MIETPTATERAFIETMTQEQELIVKTGAAVVTFEDHGQDFLVWTIKDHVVVDCEPFQKSVWCGTEVLSFPIVGQRLLVRTPLGAEMVVRYPLTKVEAIRADQIGGSNDANDTEVRS